MVFKIVFVAYLVWRVHVCFLFVSWRDMCKQTCTAETECTKLMNGALLSFLLTCRGKDRYRPGLYHRPDQACVMLVCRFQVACGSWLSRFGLCPPQGRDLGWASKILFSLRWKLLHWVEWKTSADAKQIKNGKQLRWLKFFCNVFLIVLVSFRPTCAVKQPTALWK